MSTTIRTIVCDYNDLSLRSTVATLEEDARFSVLGAFSAPDGRLRSYESMDLLILDPYQGQRFGTDFSTLAEIDSVILIYSEHCEPSALLTLLDIGISGYLVKSRTSASRLTGVAASVIWDSVFILDDTILRQVWDSRRVVAFATVPQEFQFTRREKEILSMMCSGLNDQTIARMIGISVSTVETHISNIARKLGASNRFDCALKAIQHGAIRVRDENHVEPHTLHGSYRVPREQLRVTG